MYNVISKRSLFFSLFRCACAGRHFTRSEFSLSYYILYASSASSSDKSKAEITLIYSIRICMYRWSGGVYILCIFYIQYIGKIYRGNHEDAASIIPITRYFQ